MSWLILFVFYSLLYNSLIQDLIREESKGKEEQQEEAVLEEDQNRRRSLLSVRVTIIRNVIYHCMTKRHLQCLIYLTPLLASY